jgi:hypothetical protein
LSRLNEEPTKIKAKLSKHRNRNKKLKYNDLDDENNSNDDLIDNNNRENFFSEIYSDDANEYDGGESPSNENKISKNNKNRYAIIETEFYETEDNNNNNIFKSNDTGYQGGSNNSLKSSLNRIISKNSLVKNKNLSYGNDFYNYHIT